MRHQSDQSLRQFNHALGRTIQAVALLHLPARGLIDVGMTMPEDDRTPAAHEIEIFAAVDVPEVTALGAREKLRIARRQAGCPHMSVHAAGHDLKSASTQALVQTCDPAFSQSQLLRPSCKKDISCGNRHNRLIHGSATSATHNALPMTHSIDAILGSARSLNGH